MNDRAKFPTALQVADYILLKAKKDNKAITNKKSDTTAFGGGV